MPPDHGSTAATIIVADTISTHTIAMTTQGVSGGRSGVSGLVLMRVTVDAPATQFQHLWTVGAVNGGTHEGYAAPFRLLCGGAAVEREPADPIRPVRRWRQFGAAGVP